jgi:hypothetical protein
MEEKMLSQRTCVCSAHRVHFFQCPIHHQTSANPSATFAYKQLQTIANLLMLHEVVRSCVFTAAKFINYFAVRVVNKS